MSKEKQINISRKGKLTGVEGIIQAHGVKMKINPSDEVVISIADGEIEIKVKKSNQETIKTTTTANSGKIGTFYNTEDVDEIENKNTTAENSDVNSDNLDISG